MRGYFGSNDHHLRVSALFLGQIDLILEAYFSIALLKCVTIHILQFVQIIPLVTVVIKLVSAKTRLYVTQEMDFALANQALWE